MTLLAYANACGLDPDSETRAALDDSTDLVRRFIIENSDITADALAGARAHVFDEYRHMKANDADLCVPDNDSGTGAMYRSMVSYQSPGEMRAWTTRFVSVPRDPRQGGCL